MKRRKLIYFSSGENIVIPSQFLQMDEGQSLGEYPFTRGTPRVITNYITLLGTALGLGNPNAATVYSSGAFAHNGSSSGATDWTVKVLNGATNGCALLEVNGSGSNHYWNTDNTPGPLALAAAARIATATPHVIIFTQGQTEATYVGASTGNRDTYKATLKLIFQYFRDEAGNQSLPIFIRRIGSHNTGSNTGYQRIRDLQTQITSEMSRVYIAADEFDKELASGAAIANCTTDGTTAVVLCPDTSALSEDDIITGAGVPDNSWIISIVANTSFTLNRNTTATATVTLYRQDPVHLYPGSDGVQPLDTAGGTTHDTTKGFYRLLQQSIRAITQYYASAGTVTPGPMIVEIASAVQGENTIDLTIDHDQGTTLTTINGAISSASAPYFRVEVNGANNAVTDVSLVNATTLRLTLTSALTTGTIEVWYGYGAMNKKNEKNFIHDDSTYEASLLATSPIINAAMSQAIEELPVPDTLADLTANAVAQWDATMLASWDGVTDTQKWMNVIASPADGSAQTAYDLRLGSSSAVNTSDPTFTGTPGDPAAYFSLDGGDFFELITSNTAFLASLHKTTGGGNFTFGIIYEPGSTSNGVLMCTYNSTSSVGLRIDTDTNITMDQRGDTANAGTASFGSLSTGNIYFLAMSHDHAGNITRRWLDTGSGTNISHTFNATTTDASVNFHIGSRNDSAGFMPTGSKIYGAFLLNTAADDTLMSSIISAYNTWHGRTYA